MNLFPHFVNIFSELTKDHDKFAQGKRLMNQNPDHIQWNCSECGETIQVDGDLQGNLVRCPECDSPVQVPEEQISSRPAENTDASAPPEAVEDQPSSPHGNEPRKNRSETSTQQISSTTVISKSISTLFDEFSKFILIALTVMSPVLISAIVIMSTISDPDSAQTAWLIANRAGGFLLTPILSGAMILGVFRKYQGKPFEVSSSLQMASSSALSLIAVSFLYGIMVGLGLLFCIFPGIYLSIILYVTIPALVIENTGIIDAFKRSNELITNNRWQVCGILLIAGFLNLAVGIVVGALIGGISGAAFGSQMQEQIHMLKLKIGIESLMSLVTNSFWAITVVTTYYHLRRSKEDLEIEELTKIFE